MKKITLLFALLTVSISYGQTNLFVNGDFETGVTSGTGWNDGVATYSYVTEAVQLNGTLGANASYTVDVAAQNGTYYGVKKSGSSAFIQLVDVTVGKTYEVNFWFYNSYDTNTIMAKIRNFTGDVNGSFLNITPIVPDSGANATNPQNYGTKQADGRIWKEAKFSFTVPTGITKIKFQYWSGDTGFNFMDNASMVEQTTASVENLKQFSFKSYPNPVNNSLNITAKETIDNVAIYNLLGKEVFSKAVNSNKTTIDTSTLSKGIYILKSTINGISGSSKFIKE
ncbi:MAG: T9SS type A sorting domain-containing protein [Polaribacter sp.]